MTAVTGTPIASPRRARQLREIGLGYLLVLPALAIFAVFTFYPFFHNFKLALYQTPPALIETVKKLELAPDDQRKLFCSNAEKLLKMKFG